MWHKTFAGSLSGLLFLLFVPAGVSLIFPAITALMITISIVVFLPAWAGIMTYCFASHSTKQAWLRATKFALPSLLFYFITYISFGFPQ